MRFGFDEINAAVSYPDSESNWGSEDDDGSNLIVFSISVGTSNEFQCGSLLRRAVDVQVVVVDAVVTSE